MPVDKKFHSTLPYTAPEPPWDPIAQVPRNSSPSLALDCADLSRFGHIWALFRPVGGAIFAHIVVVNRCKLALTSRVRRPQEKRRLMAIRNHAEENIAVLSAQKRYARLWPFLAHHQISRWKLKMYHETKSGPHGAVDSLHQSQSMRCTFHSPCICAALLPRTVPDIRAAYFAGRLARRGPRICQRQRSRKSRSWRSRLQSCARPTKKLRPNTLPLLVRASASLAPRFLFFTHAYAFHSHSLAASRPRAKSPARNCDSFLSLFLGRESFLAQSIGDALSFLSDSVVID